METNDSDSDDQDGSCLICHSKTSLSNPASSEQYFQHPLNPKPFLKDLQTYFLLRHILGISSEQLQGYLRHCPYPGDWVKVCSLCTENYVDKCTRTFLELQEVRRKYLVYRKQIIEVVKRSVENEPETEPFTYDICREVRLFVARNSKDLEDSRTNLMSSVTIGQAGTSRSTKRKLRSTPENVKGLGIANDYLKMERCDDLDNDESENWDCGVDFDYGGVQTYEPNVGITHRPKALTTHIKTKRNNRQRRRGTNASGSDFAQEKNDQSDTILTDYACNLCPKTFSHSDNLRKHKNECHSETFHYCSAKGCDYKSRRSYDVKNHIKRHHGSVSDIIDLTCPLCGKLFSKKSHLNSHMIHSREHNTGQNVACEQCDKKFNDETGLRSHQAVVHNVKEFQLHVCAFENCGKGFYRKCHLNQHETSHKGLSSDLCDKIFKTGKRLNAVTFTCAQCSMRFIKRADFLRHKKQKHSTRRMMSFKIETPTDTVLPHPHDNDAVGTANTDSDNYDKDPHDDNWNVGDSYKESDDGVKKYTRKVTRTLTVKIKGPPEPEAGVVDEDNAATSTANIVESEAEGNSSNDACDGDPHDDDWNAEDSDSKSDDDVKKRKTKRTRKVKVTTKTQTDKIKGPPKIRRPRKQKSAEPGFTPIAFTGEDGVVKYRCEHEGCSTILRYSRSYNRHLKLKHGHPEMPDEFFCDVCGQKLDNRLSFSLHMSKTHGIRATKKGKDGVDDGETSKCSHCGLVLRCKQNMERHIQIKHLREYSIFCELCGKGMVTRTELKYHRVQYHFICAADNCAVTCEGRKEIWAHHKEVHNMEVGLFRCNECGKLFTSNHQLKNHLDVHEYKRRKQEQPAEKGATGVLGQYVCDLCGKRFPVRKYLNHHMSYKHGKNKDKIKTKKKSVGKKDSGDSQNNVKEEY